MHGPLLTWYDAQARELPWRSNRHWYRVWVSEIMLQQTQVASVIPYFERFMARFPDVQTLAAATLDDVLRSWEGLGYYRRARQLHEAAGLIISRHGGEFPRCSQTAQTLPGIGRYTAGAILSIAFDLPEPILEANTRRVLSRLMAFRGDPAGSQGQRQLWQLAQDCLPARRAGDFNQALMELGSLLCKPRQPACGACPLAGHCRAFQLGLQEQIPKTTRRMTYEDRREVAVVVRDREHVLLRRCGEQERWAGLWDFPRFPVPEPVGPSQLAALVREHTGLKVEIGERLTTLRHGVTRFRITLDCYQARLLRRRRLNGDHVWVTPAELSDYALNTTGRKIGQLLRSV